MSNHHADVASLPQGARVGTASLRRQSLLAAQRPDLRIGVLRGNVGTRLRKLDEGEFDAILLACAGLRRLGLSDRIREALDVERFIPAIGQGVIGIEARSVDARTRQLLSVLHHPTSATRLSAERALNERLGGACTVPVAGHAVVSGGHLRLCAMVGAPDGSRVVRDEIAGDAAQGAQLGTGLAERLLASGAREILGALGIQA